MKAPEKIYLVKFKKSQGYIVWQKDRPEECDEYAEYLRADLAPMPQAEADGICELFKCSWYREGSCNYKGKHKPCKTP